MEKETTQGVTRVTEGDGTDEIAKRVPPLCAAGIVASSECAASIYARALRKKGVRSVFLRGAPSEDVRLLVALGGDAEADAAKRLSAQYALSVFCVLTGGVRTALDGFYTHGYCTVPCAVPVGAAVCEELLSPQGLPHSLANICAAAVAVCDGETAARLTGRPVGNAERVFDIVYDALDAAKQGRGCPTLPKQLAAFSLSLAVLAQEEGLPSRAAGEDCARCARRLLKHEQRAALPPSVLSFLFGEKLGALYSAFLKTPLLSCPPPNANLRAARLTEYLGLSPLLSAHAASLPPLSALAAFRLREYSEELLSRAEECARVFSEARRPFCRLFPDDGFSLVGALDPSDIKTVVALAPDLFPPFVTLLGVMRAAGVLDRYL